MSNLPLGFGELALGGICLAVGLSDSHSFRDVLAGTAKFGGSGPQSSAEAGSGGTPNPGAVASAVTAYSGAIAGAPGSVGFHPNPGTDFTSGQESTIASRLNALAHKLKVSIVGISGARTPDHSVAVGGSATDPHTRGQAADIGVNSGVRSSAGFLTEAQLESVGLTRPLAGPDEINHIQLLAGYSTP